MHAPRRYPTYPFPTRLRWFLASRSKHILVAVRLESYRVPEEDRGMLETRARHMGRAILARTIILAILSAGYGVTALAWTARYAPVLAPVKDLGEMAAGWLSFFAGAATLAFLAVNRLVGQLEADLILLVGGHAASQPSPEP